jgi:hypothetical protein
MDDFKMITIQFSLLFSLACSKDNSKTESVNDCVTQNFGVLTINYTNLSDCNAIDVTKVGVSGCLKLKFFAVGIAKDTIRLQLGS